MSSCTKCNKCTSVCGCSEDTTAMGLTCDFPACPNPETCAEQFSTDCIIWTSDAIADLGIPKGANLTTVLQKIMGAIVNPGCNLPGGTCLSVVGFSSTAIAKTTATFGWGAVVGATNYAIEYKLPSAPSYTLNPVVTTTYDTIGPLLPDTEYYVRVRTNCPGGTCYSLTLSITTLPN